jgi:hypothetical protein
MPGTEELEAIGRAEGLLPPAPGAPLVLGRYRLGGRLGAGGFGTVHAAHDERLDRAVAVKVIPADGPAPERAQREAIAVARLDHPAIVALHDAGQDAHARYLVSELVRGRTLAELEKAGALSDRDVVRIGLALTDALAHAHERGVIHRDVKPQNVIVPEEEDAIGRPRLRGPAKLTDFGVAHLVDEDALTRTGDIVGTLAYMAPEQAAGHKVDERADLYSLGVVLYEALAGHNPVAGVTPAATAKRLGKPLPALARKRPDLPAPLTAGLDRAVKVAPGERGTLDELFDALAEALPEASDAGGHLPPHPLERRLPALPPGVTRLLAPAAAGALTTAALAGLLDRSPVAPLLAGLVVAALVVVLPRAGWLAAALAVVGLLTLAPEARAGSAVLVLAATVFVPLLVPEDGRAWSLPAAAPLLGLAGLAGAFPVLAARAPRAASRAALGALGAWWLLLAEPLLDRGLLLGPATGVPPRAGFEDGASLAAADVIAPTVTSGAVGLVVVWALAAVVLPWIVRGRWLGTDLLAAAAWATGLALATEALATWIAQPEPRGLVVGAVAAAALALALRPPGTGHTVTMDRKGSQASAAPRVPA